MYNARTNTFRASIESNYLMKSLIDFYQNHLQDQIQTLQSGKISVAYSRDLLRAQHEQ
jgi:hypothetical protein